MCRKGNVEQAIRMPLSRLATAKALPAQERMKNERPHPEEPCAARRLEGWPRVLAVHPSFETRPSGAPQDEAEIISHALSRAMTPLRIDRGNRTPAPSSPNLPGHFHHEPQLRPLLVLGQHIALFARGKSALRRKCDLIERHVFRCLLDAALDIVLVFQCGELGRHETQHDDPLACC